MSTAAARKIDLEFFIPGMGRTMKSTRPSSDVCKYYFTQLDDDGISWECRKCSNVKRKSGGWTNLYSH
jgi:hypothetical protein